MNRIGDTAVQRDTHSVCNLCVILFHSLANPVKHDTDKPIFVKIGNKTFFFFSNLKSFGFSSTTPMSRLCVSINR